MSSRRQPWPWEEGVTTPDAPESKPWTPPVVLPTWGGTGEHRNARQGIDRMARRHMEQARQQGLTEYTYDEAEAAGRACAYRHDDRNNR